MVFHLQMQCDNTFDENMDKDITIEKSVIAKGLVKIYRDNKDKIIQSNDKPQF